jgi:hypothetical protein
VVHAQSSFLGLGWEWVEMCTSNRALNALAFRHSVEKAQVVKPEAIKFSLVAL